MSVRQDGTPRAGFTRGHWTPRAGFTLVELLVAIAIIAILSGLLLAAVGSARRASAAKATKAVIERLKLACESYAADFGDYPPSSLDALGKRGNGVNEGAEALVRCLSTKREKGPYVAFEDKDLANTDGDSMPPPDPTESSLASRELFEAVDAWGNPLIYVHHRDYLATGNRLSRYEPAAGERFEVKVRPSGKTGQFPGVTSFVIWSAGPDGKNEDGEGDDVCSWK